MISREICWIFLKFIYSEKATKFCEIFTLLLSYVVPVKSKVNISQNFVTFSEYMNFNILVKLWIWRMNWDFMQAFTNFSLKKIESSIFKMFYAFQLDD